MNLSIVDLEQLERRELVGTRTARVPGQAQHDNTHALVHENGTNRDVAKALENVERLRGNVLACRAEHAIRSSHHRAVLDAPCVRCERCSRRRKGLRRVQAFWVVQGDLDRLFTCRKLRWAWCKGHLLTGCVQRVDGKA